VEVAKVIEAVPLGRVPLKANSFQGTSLEVIWELFSDFATKYKQIHKKVPVLIIDNVNTLAEDQEDTLKTLLEYAKLATDDSIATFVFVSDEGGVPRQMVGKSI
jgi:hypothetical protein